MQYDEVLITEGGTIPNDLIENDLTNDIEIQNNTEKESFDKALEIIFDYNKCKQSESVLLEDNFSFHVTDTTSESRAYKNFSWM